MSYTTQTREIRQGLRGALVAYRSVMATVAEGSVDALWLPHVQSKDNPHEVTKAHVGLSQVANYRPAGPVETSSGLRDDLYLMLDHLPLVLDGGTPPLPPPPVRTPVGYRDQNQTVTPPTSPTEPVWSDWFDEPIFFVTYSAAMSSMFEYMDGARDDETTRWRVGYPFSMGAWWVVPLQSQVFAVPSIERSDTIELHASPYAYLEGSNAGQLTRREYRLRSVGSGTTITFTAASWNDLPHTITVPDATIPTWVWQCRDITDTGAVSDWSYPVLALTAI